MSNPKGNPSKLSIKDRFISKMSKSNKKGCIIFKAAINKGGYCVFSIGQKDILAHRMSYELFIGTIPKRLLVLHKCDIRNCVAPKHLYLGTDQDNVNDMIKRKRNFRSMGENNFNAKLTKTDIKEIRKLYKVGFVTRELAEIFDVSKNSISNILNQVTWKHIV